MNFKITKNKIIAAITIGMALLAAFWYGGNAPGLRGWNTSEPSNKVVVENQLEPSEVVEPEKAPAEEKIDIPEETLVEAEVEPEKEEIIEPLEPDVEPELETKVEAKAESESKSEPAPEPKPETKAPKKEKTPEMVINKETGKDKYLTGPVPEGKPTPMEPQNTKISDAAHTATLSVRVDTILNNMDWLDPEKVELIPEDGVVFPATTATFYEGESVFNLLQREMKKAKIHMEFTNTPIYNSSYIEGIQNLYEFDCGELSGWMYKVNGWFPNYGASRYALKEGDIVEWVYTCDLGIDVSNTQEWQKE